MKFIAVEIAVGIKGTKENSLEISRKIKEEIATKNDGAKQTLKKLKNFRNYSLGAFCKEKILS